MNLRCKHGYAYANFHLLVNLSSSGTAFAVVYIFDNIVNGRKT